MSQAAKPRILIVDDQPRNLDVLEAMLDDMECTFVRATSADEALLCLMRQDFAALVLDIKMPGMNGIDVMHFLTECGVYIPTIVITAHDEAASRNKCLSAGAAAYLRKPLDADELLKAIEDAVARGKPVGPTSN